MCLFSITETVATDKSQVMGPSVFHYSVLIKRNIQDFQFRWERNHSFCLSFSLGCSFLPGWLLIIYYFIIAIKCCPNIWYFFFIYWPLGLVSGKETSSKCRSFVSEADLVSQSTSVSDMFTSKYWNTERLVKRIQWGWNFE